MPVIEGPTSNRLPPTTVAPPAFGAHLVASREECSQALARFDGTFQQLNSLQNSLQRARDAANAPGLTRQQYVAAHRALGGLVDANKKAARELLSILADIYDKCGPPHDMLGAEGRIYIERMGDRARSITNSDKGLPPGEQANAILNWLGAATVGAGAAVGAGLLGLGQALLDLLAAQRRFAV